MKPVKGNFPQGFSPRQGDVKLSNASGSMWMNPVARITPAAKALIMKKISFSGLKLGILRPSSGMLTPTAPAKRIVAIEANLYLSASLLFFSVISASHVQLQSPDTRVGERIIKRNRKEKAPKLIIIWRVGENDFGLFVEWIDRVFLLYRKEKSVYAYADSFESVG